MKRLFIAIKVHPDASFLAQYEIIKESLRANKISWVKPENFHTTLKFLGNVSTDKMGEIKNELSKIQKPGYDITIRELGIFGSRYKPRVLWAKIEDQDNTKHLALEIIDKMELIGFPKDRQNVVPHLTLGRIHRLHNTAYFHSKLQRVKKSFLLTNRIDAFYLYESVPVGRGVEYRILGKYPML